MQGSNSRQRLLKEYRDVQREKVADPDIQLVCDDANIFKWTALIKGPSATPYEGGVFQLAISVPKEYPLQAPQVRFLTKIFHPNVHFKSTKFALDGVLILSSDEAKDLNHAIGHDMIESVMLCYMLTIVAYLLLQDPAKTIVELDHVSLCMNKPYKDTGEICLDILKNAWSPAWTLQSICRAIIALMAHPEPDSPLNCDSGNLLRSGDIRGFDCMARMYTRLAAMPKKG